MKKIEINLVDGWSMLPMNCNIHWEAENGKPTKITITILGKWDKFKFWVRRNIYDWKVSD